MNHFAGRWAVFLVLLLALPMSVARASSSLAPTITTQPANKTVNVGQTATFTVVATGGTLTYQWKKNGTNVAGGTGATTASYTTAATVIGDNGAKFTVDVTDATGTTTSAQATLTVNAPPAITTQPANASIVENQTATFTVVATGNSLTYQWQKNGVDVVGGTGGTTASYTTPAVVIGDNNAKYTVIVTNTAGTVTSNQATLTVGAATPVSITTQPGNATILEGQTATFTVVAAGSAPITYQWRRGATNVGTNSASYTTPPAVLPGDNGAVYSVVVSNIKGPVTSSNAVLTVNAATPVAIATQPANQSAFVGQTATFTVAVTGSTPISYQWMKDGVNVTNGTGGTTATYTTPVLDLTFNNAKYTVKVSNVNNTNVVTSNQATLTVNPVPPPTITTQPANTTVVAGQTASFSVVATGLGTLTYQWKKNGVNVVGGTGGTTATYTTPATVPGDNGAVYSVVVTNSAGPSTSNNATLTVTPLTPPTITVQPASRTVNVGFAATFSVTATSTATITYQWYKNGILIAGATGTTYTTPVTVAGDNGAIYTVVVTNTAGGTTSTPATLTVETGGGRVPDPYLDIDIGATTIPGDANLDGSVFTVCGSGTGIGGTADAFHFLYQPLSGDGTIISRVNPGTTNAQAKSGVMIRETLTAGSATAGMFITGSSGTVFVQRLATSGTAALVTGSAAPSLPYWVKLERTGNTFVGSTSPDGTNWTVVGTATIAMPSGAFIGFAATSADNGELNCAEFDAFSGTGGWRPALRAPKGGGGGGGGCGLLGLEGIVLALGLRRVRRDSGS